MIEPTISEDRQLVIPFSEIYDVPEECDVFKVIKKRSYNKLLEVIIEVMNIVFNKSSKRTKKGEIKLIDRYNEEVVEKYAEIHLNIIEKSYEVFTDFTNELRELIDMIKTITRDYVDLVYADTAIEKNIKKSNIELQFTVEHNKIIIRSSFMIKFIIPLVMEYLENYTEDLSNDRIMLDCFAVCFDANEEEGVDIKSKLFKIVSSRIKTTRYSDRPIWVLLSNMSTTPDVQSNNFYRKIILDIIPKLVHEKNIISFIHVSLKQMLQFAFRYNYPISYTPKNLIEVVDPSNDKITNLERLEFNITRVDESKGYLDRAKIYETVLSCFQNDKIPPITKEELKYYSDNVILNKVQMNFLFLFLCRKLERYSICYQLTYTEYMVLLIYFKKWLAANGFSFLSKWITASFNTGSEAVDEKKVINNKAFMTSLLDSKDFNYLVYDKYISIKYFISNNNVIAKKVSTILLNDCTILPSYEQSLEGKKPEVIEGYSPTEKQVVADEVLKLIKMI